MLESDRATELANLKMLSNLPERLTLGVPTLKNEHLTTAESLAVLAMPPLGIPGQPCLPDGMSVSCRHIVQLVDIVEEVHKIGFAHRDIKPANILLTASSKLFLNDWGSASRIGEMTLFEGTYGFYDFSVIGTSEMRHLPTAEADLIALVRSAYLMIFNQQPPLQGENLESFWKGKLSISMWKKLLDAACTKDYEVIRNTFKTQEFK
jgi:hypothetical protein